MSSPSDDPRRARIGAVLGGRYRVLGFLGAGGMGAVYEVEDQAGQHFALKVLHERPMGSGGDQTLARFIREAQVTSTLSNPHIVPTYDGGIDPELGLPYLVMPLLHGEDLDTLVGRVGPLHPTVAVRLVLQAAQGIMAAHAAGVIHRDIKPQNVFVDVRGNEVTAKVCDFGLAKQQADGALTATGSMLGSPLYMAPEQLVSARKVDARADVWSLGMTLYQALAGLPALHQVTTFAELAIAVATQVIPHLQDAAPWVDPGLATIVHGALIRDVDQRCPSVGAFHRALSAFSGGSELVTAPMLAPMPEELRRSVAPRAAYPLSWGSSSASYPPAPGEEGPDPLLGKRLAGRYEILRVIGKGGMGAVYEARANDGSLVAVKVVGIGQQSPEAMARFIREARAAMSIQSPYVVRVLDADTDVTYRVPFIVMELLRGTDLDRLIKDAGPLEPAACAAVFLQACDGLEAAHALGVVHRDIKPANLFLHEGEDGRVVVKVCDFGVAKQLSNGDADAAATELTRTGGIVGSPMYMSPEQAKNAKTVDRRTDVWSLCMAMHQALSGRKPWESASTVGELIVAICTQTPTPIQDMAPWVEPALAEAIHRGLRREPGDRWASAAELRAAIAPFATTEPLTRPRLTALTADARARIAPRGAVQSSRPGNGTETVNAATFDRLPPQPRRSILPIAVGGAAIAAVAAGLALGFSSRPRPVDPAPVPGTASPSASAKSSADATQAARVTAHVAIKPADGAVVSVNGVVNPTDSAGRLALEGEIGESFDVLVLSPHGRGEAKIVLSRDGKATPAVIEVVHVPAAKTATTAGKGGAPAVGVTAPPATTTVTAPPVPTATTPKPKDTWLALARGTLTPSPPTQHRSNPRHRGGFGPLR